MLRFPVINEWACALMCASHAEDGCCTYKNNPKRVGDENDGDNYEAPQHIQRLTFLLRPCSLGRPEAPLVTTIIPFTCWISFPKIFESADFPMNEGPLLLPKKKCARKTPACASSVLVSEGWMRVKASNGAPHNAPWPSWLNLAWLTTRMQVISGLVR